MSSRRSNHQGSCSGTGYGAGHGSTQQRPAAAGAAAVSTRATSSTTHHNHTINDLQQQLQQQQEPTTVSEIGNATHIVVEHHRSGTVKTHVFSSKDGKPSLLGHEVPDTSAALNSFKEAFEAGLEDKMKALKTLVKDSLDHTTKTSLDKVDSVKLAVVESERRITDHVSLVTSSAFEQHIKADVVPKLDSIERLLLANSINNGHGGNGTKARSGTASPQSDLSGASLEHMDQRSPPKQSQPGEKTEVSGEEEAAAAVAEEEGEEVVAAITAPEVVEKLNSMQSQLGALCRVVIDGVEPQQDDAQLDPEMAAKVAAMRERLTSMDESSQPEPEPATPDKLDELIQIVNTNQQTHAMAAAAAHEFALQQEQTRKEEEGVWKTSLNEMLTSQRDGLGGLDAQLVALENAFKNMDAGFQDWTKTHRMSLNVYLKYMYMVFKSTKGVESRIDTALEDVRAQAAMEPESRLQLSNDLQSLRSEIAFALNSLPDAVASAIRRSQEPVILEELPSGGDDSIPAEAAMARSEPEFDAAAAVSAAADVPQPDSEEPSVEVAEESTPDPVMERLAFIVETLQGGIASLVEKYGELSGRISPPRDPAPIDPEAPEPPPREPTVEDRLSALEEQLVAARAVEATTSSNAAAKSTASAPTSGGEATEDANPPAPAARAANPNPGPSPGYLGRSPSVIAAVSAAADASGTPAAAESSRTEVVETQESGNVAAVEIPEAALPPIPVPNFIEELEAMNKSLTDLLNTVNEGQIHLHQEMQREFMRVIHTIHPPETEEDRVRKREAENQARIEEVEANSRRAVEEERRAVEAEQFRLAEEKRRGEDESAAQKAAEERNVALERISMIPNLMSSLEAVNYHFGLKTNELQNNVREGFGELRAGTAAVEGQVVACLNKVQLIVDGNIQDSIVLNEIKYQVDVIGAKLEEPIRADDEALKEQVTEAIRKTENVLVLVEDVKKISEKSLTVQEEFQKQVGEWHQKQDGEIEALGKKHGESWEAWYKKHDDEWQAWRQTHGDSQGHLVGLHNRQDRYFHEFVDARRGYDEELQGWHRAHDGRLEELEKRRCRCCMPEPSVALESDDKSAADGPIPSRPPTVDCCGGDAGDTDACSRRVRELLEEFLQRILPGYNPGAASFASHSTSGAIVTEPRGPNGAGIEGVDGDPTEQRPTSPDLSFATRNTSEIIVPEPSIHATAADPAGSVDPTAIPRGEAASYHGAAGEAPEGVEATTAAHVLEAAPAEGSSRALSTPPSQSPLPQALYDLLLPFFHPDIAASAASAVAESAALAAKAKELEDLQTKLELMHREALDNEERYLTTIRQKTREIEETASDREKMEEEFLARQAAWHEAATSYQQELAKVRNDLDTIRADYDSSRLENTNLYRMGFGLKPLLPNSVPAPAAESGEEESDSVSEHGSSSSVPSSSSSTPEIIPHAGLMAEASASLIQALEEFKQHQAILHQENRMLEDKRDGLLAEVAAMEQKRFELSTAAAAATASQDQQTQPQGETRSSSPQEGAPELVVDDDDDENYVTEDENGSMRGRSIGTGRSRAQSVLSGSSGSGVGAGGAGVGGGSAAGARPSGASARSSRQQRRQSVYSRAQSRGRAIDMHHQQDRVPQLEADVRICQDGVQSETLLSSKTVLTDEQYERIRSSRAEAGMDPGAEDVWSLSFAVCVKMVPAP
ncbi:hypothetical protein BGW39_011385 [Mortierella sp. 14UC]|nr:hypothetical protein BGW39_011385 [Mortierella sp. 14UC]